jgi:hypothetical protein
VVFWQEKKQEKTNRCKGKIETKGRTTKTERNRVNGEEVVVKKAVR